MVEQVPPPRRPSGPASLPTSSGQAGKPREPRHGEWTRAKMAGFLRELAATRSVSRAAVAVGMGRQSAYKLRKRIAGFAKAWDEVVEPSRLTIPRRPMAAPLRCPLCGVPAGRR